MNKKTFNLYWRHIKNHKRTFFVMLFAIPVGAAVIDSILPYVLAQAIGELSGQNNDGNLTSILWLAAGVGLIGAILNYVGFRTLVMHESNMVQDLRESTFVSLMHKDYNFFANNKIGSMTSRYIDFVRSYVTIQDLFIIRTLGFVLTVGSGTIILANQSPTVAEIFVILIAILVFEIRWSTKKRAPWRHERKNLISEIHGDVADTLTNSLVVKSYASEGREIAKLQKKTRRFTVIFRKDIGFIMTEGSTRVLLMIITQIVAIIISAGLIKSGQMNIATAVFVLAYMQRIGSQLFVLGDIINGYDQAFLDAQPMTEMLLSQNSVDNIPHSKNLVLKSPSITLHDVTFRYPSTNIDVLSKVSLTIPAGQKVGLVGPSGAGKSTLVNLLLRFSDTTDGSILIDGQDIKNITQSSLRNNIAYVPQEPMLFHRSIKENIIYGKPNASEKQIISAAKRSNALDFINQLPQSFDTMVGERGIKLSGGQRQRVAIARAILKDSPILILDEATSALDSESEKLIQESLENLMKNRTSIVIAHRLSTIAKLDRIIVLENGKIIEDGTHQNLLAQKGTYAKLWAHQSGGFIEE
ncbi:MAG: ABC transporter ATP-binding protein [Candidatus Saccharibacteria bacterium]